MQHKKYLSHPSPSGSEVVFAPRALVIEEHGNWAYRSKSIIDDYNLIAREVLVPHGVRTNKPSDFAQKNCEAFHHVWVNYSNESSAMLVDEII